MSAITFQAITKRFGDVVAVDELDLEVDDGEFMVLLGPSGCGKTTALRIVAGLEQADTGALRIGDRDVTRMEAKDRDVAMVFQSYALYPHMTVAANIESPLVARRISPSPGEPPRKLTRDERRTRVRDAAATLGLTDLLGRKPAALSGGQRQRVALARAIVSRPAAFLMDEPLSNLDAKLRVQTRLELVDLHQRLSTTFLYVTHDQVEAMTMATRMAILAGGRLQQVGSPRDVYDQPDNLFVAGFIGSPPMNALRATIEVHDGLPWAVTSGGSLALGRNAPVVEHGQEVVIGIRPEQLRLADEGLAGVVRAVEWLGYERHVVAEVAGVSVTIREGAAGPDPSPGQLVHVTADPGAVRLFDSVTEQRLR